MLYYWTSVVQAASGPFGYIEGLLKFEHHMMLYAEIIIFQTLQLPSFQFDFWSKLWCFSKRA